MSLGYIGGAVLAAILNNPTLSSAFTITAIVRSVEKAEKLKAVGVKSAVGSISDEPFVENLVKESDWVISTVRSSINLRKAAELTCAFCCLG